MESTPVRVPSGFGGLSAAEATAGGIKSVGSTRSSGNGGSIYAMGVGVAGDDAHACHENWKEISKRSEQFGRKKGTGPSPEHDEEMMGR